MKKKSLFITFEGTEGCGKSTQTKLLADYLTEQGYGVLHTREPGGTDLGGKIRDVLLESRLVNDPVAETLLFMASRAQLVSEKIQPALKRGEIVICDRWLDATVAYQGYGLGVDVAWIGKVAAEATRGVTPKLTFFLDLPVKLGFKRIAGRGKMDRIESRALAFHEKVRQGYLKIARSQRKRFRIIPVTTPDETHSKIREAVKRVL